MAFHESACRTLRNTLSEFGLQFYQNLLDDFVLYRKDILLLPVKAVRLEVAPVEGLDQLDGNPKFDVRLLLNAASKHVLDALLLGYLFHVDRLPFVGGGRTPRDHELSGCPRKRRRQVLGLSTGEKFNPFSVTFVLMFKIKLIEFIALEWSKLGL
jgi:hypothetical protein